MPDIGTTFGAELPKTIITSPSTSSSISELANYGMAEGGKLLTEGWKKTVDTFGDINPFKKAAVNVPAAPTVSVKETQGTAASIKANTQSDNGADTSTSHKVKLTASVADGEVAAIVNDVNYVVEPLMQRVVEFDIMPDVQENRTVDYEAVSTPQMPTEFQKYKGTKGVSWQISGAFVCRTRNEAKRNLVFINTLRGWTMPYFGEKQSMQFADGGVRGKLGAPPPVLKFSGWRGLIGEVPVVITSVYWQWPHDCDWIPTGVFDEDGREIPFPTVMNVNVTVQESFSPEEVNGFDLVSFRNGRMVNAWLAEDEQPHSFNVSQPLHSNGGNPSSVNGTAQADGSGIVKLPTTQDIKRSSISPYLSAVPSISTNISKASDGGIIETKNFTNDTYKSLSVPNVNAGGNIPGEAASTQAVVSQNN